VTSSYLELRALISSPQGRSAITIGSLQPDAAATAAAKHGLHEPSAAGDRLLLAACSTSDDGAFLCLRCRISHPIEQKLRDLHRRFADSYGLDLIELASYGLDDDGRTLSYQPLSALPAARITPFTAQVICSYDASRGAGLPHWARTKLQAHNGLKAYLLEHGLLLISNWALLADSAPRRVRHAWEGFGAGSLTVEAALALHAAYRSHYPEAKVAYRRRTGKASGWEPDDAFLSSISPGKDPKSTSSQLVQLADTIRMARSGRWQWTQQPQADDGEGTEIEIADPSTLTESIEPDGPSAAEQLALITAALDRATAAVMPAVLAPASTNSQLHCLWQGFGEGLTNTPLAERCGCARGTVSKKLRSEHHAATIARQATTELLRNPTFSPLASSLEDLERMVEALRNHLLHPEREGDIAPLRRWVHQHLPVS
jgi:hypothetical protein